MGDKAYPPAGYPHQPPPAQYPPASAPYPPSSQYPSAPPPPQQPVYGTPAQQSVPVVQVTHPPVVTYVQGVTPQAPTGFMYVRRERISILALLIAIFFCPIGLIALCCIKEYYWELVPVTTVQA